MDFTNRDRELARLGAALRHREGSLVVLWGRRRVGKTRLLLEWVRHSGGIYWVADGSGAPIQRRYFAEAIAAKLAGFSDVEYPDWRALFTRLAAEAQRARWRGPLVVDELPYLLDASPELPAVLQRFVDHDAPKAGLTLALAGSSQRMMQGLALDADAPLYGRARELMKLQPISPHYIGAALGLRDAPEIIRTYAAFGGIPRYWELAAPYAGVREAVDALALDPLGVLHDEPARLLLEENPPAVGLRPILDAIGGGAHRVSEIGGRIGEAATALSRPLVRLQELDLIVRETPFGEPERSTKRALYKLADPFLRLWFSLVAPKRSLLLQINKAARLALFDSAFPHLCAVAWEEVCRRAIPLLADKLGGVEHGPAQRYWGAGQAEWDVVARATRDGSLLLGEVKWKETPATANDVDDAIKALLGKGVAAVAGGKKNAGVRHVVFLPSAPRHKGVRHGVHVLDAKDVLDVLRSS